MIQEHYYKKLNVKSGPDLRVKTTIKATFPLAAVRADNRDNRGKLPPNCDLSSVLKTTQFSNHLDKHRLHLCPGTELFTLIVYNSLKSFPQSCDPLMFGTIIKGWGDHFG